MIPFGAAHTFLAYIWEYHPPAPPPPPCTPGLIVGDTLLWPRLSPDSCKKSGLITSAMKAMISFILEMVIKDFGEIHCRRSAEVWPILCQSTVDRWVGRPSVDRRPTVNRQSVDRRPTVGRPSTDLSVDRRPTYRSTVGRPTVGFRGLKYTGATKFNNTYLPLGHYSFRIRRRS